MAEQETYTDVLPPIRVTRAMKFKLSAEAQKRGISVSDLMRESLEIICDPSKADSKVHYISAEKLQQARNAALGFLIFLVSVVSLGLLR